MTISKMTSVRIFPNKRTFTLIRAHCTFNVVVRVGCLFFSAAVNLLLPGITYVDTFICLMLQGVNGMSAIIFAIVVPMWSLKLYKAFMNEMYLFNRKLAVHFDGEEFPEREGIELQMKGLKYLATVGGCTIPFTLIIGLGVLKYMKVAVSIGIWITGYRFIPILLVYVGGLYTYYLDLVINIENIVNIFVATNFMVQWLRIHGEMECTSENEKRQRQILYRAHQLFGIFGKDFAGPLIPLFVGGACIMAIGALTAGIKFGAELGVPWIIVLVVLGFSSLAVQKITIDTANKFTAASLQYIVKGGQLAKRNRNLLDQKFFRSCQPIRWNIWMVPITETLFITILDSVIVSWVMDSLLLIESG